MLFIKVKTNYLNILKFYESFFLKYFEHFSTNLLTIMYFRVLLNERVRIVKRTSNS